MADYRKAYQISLQMPFEKIKESLTNLCFEEMKQSDVIQSGTLGSYFFMDYSNAIDETAYKHDYMVDLILMNPADFYIGDAILYTALNHMKRACELEPTNIKYKEWLLEFYDHMPGDNGMYLTAEEANEVRSEIARLTESSES
ncbi:hypothetical protein [Weissella viridescens]|uniref:hypothetical protein n=1 Tax=Weissella viridescens TaxID=1629 RepID=UPI003AF2DB2F